MSISIQSIFGLSKKLIMWTRKADEEPLNAFSYSLLLFINYQRLVVVFAGRGAPVDALPCHVKTRLLMDRILVTYARKGRALP